MCNWFQSFSKLRDGDLGKMTCELKCQKIMSKQSFSISFSLHVLSAKYLGWSTCPTCKTTRHWQAEMSCPANFTRHQINTYSSCQQQTDTVCSCVVCQSNLDPIMRKFMGIRSTDDHITFYPGVGNLQSDKVHQVNITLRLWPIQFFKINTNKKYDTLYKKIIIIFVVIITI